MCEAEFRGGQGCPAAGGAPSGREAQDGWGVTSPCSIPLHRAVG